MTQIDYLWWAECPSHDAGYRLLEQALAAEKLSLRIHPIEVCTDEQAEHWHFPGSPTFRIDGYDLDPQPQPHGAATPYALTCRAYRREDGRIAPLPSLDGLRSALRRAVMDSAPPTR